MGYYSTSTNHNITSAQPQASTESTREPGHTKNAHTVRKENWCTWRVQCSAVKNFMHTQASMKWIYYQNYISKLASTARDLCDLELLFLYYYSSYNRLHMHNNCQEANQKQSLLLNSKFQPCLYLLVSTNIVSQIES